MKHLVADQPKPCAELKLRHREKQFAQKSRLSDAAFQMHWRNGNGGKAAILLP